jgi:hypothetical protein
MTFLISTDLPHIHAIRNRAVTPILVLVANIENEPRSQGWSVYGAQQAQSHDL